MTILSVDRPIRLIRPHSRIQQHAILVPTVVVTTGTSKRGSGRVVLILLLLVKFITSTIIVTLSSKNFTATDNFFVSGFSFSSNTDRMSQRRTLQLPLPVVPTIRNLSRTASLAATVRTIALFHATSADRNYHSHHHQHHHRRRRPIATTTHRTGSLDSTYPGIDTLLRFGVYRSTPRSDDQHRLFSSTIDRIMNDEMVNNPNHTTQLRGGGGDQESSLTTSDDTSPIRNYTEYEIWVRRLYATNLFHPVKLGLDNMIQLHEAIGNPMDKTCVIHIAGTNGKGSVAMKVAKTLQYAGLRVGLFCSPHVSSFRERMQINDQLISEEEVVQLLPHIYKVCKLHDIPATFFEITTVLAFRYFALHNVDVVVLETGLGGRLDATNVIQKPALSIITSIGLEHTRILGDTIELIALEKGGIMKKDCPVLVGPNVPHHTLRKCAQEKGASQYYTCNDVLGVLDDDISSTDNNVDLPSDNTAATTPVVNDNLDYDIENSRIATAAIKLLLLAQPSHTVIEGITISDDMIQRGTSHRPPCRFEIIPYINNNKGTSRPPIVILDVAHNPPAMDYLSYKLRSTYPTSKFRIVVGMSSDKDMALCSKSLKNIVSSGNNNNNNNVTDIGRIHLVEAAHPRAATLEDMWKADPELQKYAKYDVSDRSITNQIVKAITAISTTNASNDECVPNDEILVICGSVFLMAEAREALGIDEPRDSSYIAELAGSSVRHNQENFGNRPL